MEFTVLLLAMFMTLLCFWSSVGCIVSAFRMRYASLLWLSIFFASIGWNIGSLIGLPSLPKWSSGAAILALAFYRWCEHRQPPVVPLHVSHILVWWWTQVKA